MSPRLCVPEALHLGKSFTNQEGLMQRRVWVVAVVVACLAGVGQGGAQDVKEHLEKRTFKNAGGKQLTYRLLKPADYDPKQEYPLVLFLHGAGERGSDNERQLVHGIRDFAKPEVRTMYPCFLVVPQCPANEKWSDVDWGAEKHQQPGRPSEPMLLTLELLEALRKEFRIDARRIYITGLSMGGYGTWDVLVRRPELFAAAVPVCGGGDEAQAGVIAKIPIWAFHGAKDQAVRVERSRNMVAALKKAGGNPRYTEYPDVGHDSWVPAYRDPELYSWLFAQKRP
jgi:predicted peptidase